MSSAARFLLAGILASLLCTVNCAQAQIVALRAGKIAGTLVTADELPYWLEKGVQFFYVHSDPFLRSD